MQALERKVTKRCNSSSHENGSGFAGLRIVDGVEIASEIVLTTILLGVGLHS